MNAMKVIYTGTIGYILGLNRDYVKMETTIRGYIEVIGYRLGFRPSDRHRKHESWPLKLVSARGRCRSWWYKQRAV